MKIKKGQLWKENDKRFARIVKVIGFEPGKVVIQTVERRFSGSSVGRITRAKRERFNGQYHGYSPYKENDTASSPFGIEP